MSFWRTFGSTLSSLEILLDKQNFTLEELLDEEELLQEVKVQNTKLLDYITQPQNLEKIIKYAVSQPNEGDDPKYKLKYPFLCCEILCCDVFRIQDALFQNTQHLDALFSFLESDTPLHPVRSAHVIKLLITLLVKRPEEMVHYLKSKDNILLKFLNHLGSPAVMELLLKLLSSPDIVDLPGFRDWVQSSELIPNLIKKLNPTVDTDVHETAAQLLTDLSNMPSSQVQDYLLRELESEDSFRLLFSYILTPGAKSSLINGLGVVNEILKKNQQYLLKSDQEPLPPYLVVISENLPAVRDILAAQNDTTMEGPAGTIFPLGFQRLKLVEFLVFTIRTNYAAIHNTLCSLQLPSICLDMFFKHSWNNFLHLLIDQMIASIFQSDNSAFKLHLLNDCKLVDRITHAAIANKPESEENPKEKVGYSGFITRMSSSLIAESNRNPQIATILSQNDKWKDYVNESFTEARAIENKPLGGHRPAGGGNEQVQDEDDTDHLASEYIFKEQSYQSGFMLDFPDQFIDEDDLEDDDLDVSIDAYDLVEEQDDVPSSSTAPTPVPA